MNLVSVKELGHSEGGRSLFEDLTFGIEEGSRIAVVGRNGSGKSTLLDIIAGKREAGDGIVTRNRELRIAFLEQSPEYAPEDCLADFILTGESREIRLIREYESLAAGAGTEEELSRIAGLTEEIDNLNCWDLENRIHSILGELGISDLSLRMKQLSGGMIKKAALARTLVVDSNLIILDEPTNHLDIRTINWLEKYLNSNRKAVLLVTHDRYFMDRICSRIFEVEDQRLYTYDGNYTYYVEAKAEREAQKVRAGERLDNILRNEAEWIKRGPRARAGKDKKRKERFFSLKERVEPVKRSSSPLAVESRRLGGKIMEIEDVAQSWGGNCYIRDFSFSFRKGDRIGIVGSNGSGKSTLLDIIAGRLVPEKGTVDTGVNTKIGYYDQLTRQLPEDKKVEEYIKETAEVIKLQNGSTLSPAMFLERFLFPKSLMYTTISELSGGERKKLYLLNILLTNPNFLLFDEPTNDFDIQTLSILEDFLTDFSGCSVVVSHDRFFLDRTTDMLFVLDGRGGVSGFSGDVGSYYTEENEPAGEERKESPGKRVKTVKKKLSFKEKKELETIEDEIFELEAEKEKLEKLFSGADITGEKLAEKTREYDEVSAAIDAKYERWEYLEGLNN